MAKKSNAFGLVLLAAIGGAIAGLLFAPIAKPKRDELSRWVAIVASLVPMILGIVLWAQFNAATGGTSMKYVERATWIGSLGIEYFVGVDGIASTD